MFKKVKRIYVVYASIILVIVGGGFWNLQTQSKYWPNNKGELGITGLAQQLLFLIVVSSIITLLYALIAYVWKRCTKQKFTYIELIEVFIMIFILVSIPILWLIPDIV